MSVNLLPTNLKPNSGVLKATKIIKKAISLLVVLLVLMALITSGVYFFNRSTINTLNTNSKDLTDRIESLENTEQSIYLLRDRLSKIDRIKSNSGLGQYLDDSKLLASFISNDVVVESLDVSSTSIKFGISTDSSAKITDFLTNLQSSNLFTNVRMESLNYNQNLGFTADFIIRN